jgi:hypothetical protein
VVCGATAARRIDMDLIIEGLWDLQCILMY